MNDPIGDMLTRIRNAHLRGKSTVKTPASKLRGWVLDVLANEGYIVDFEVKKDGASQNLEIELKYYEGKPVIENIERTSKPGLRIYRNKEELPKVLGGLGVSIISTSAGVMSDRQARKNGIGGEVLCIVS